MHSLIKNQLKWCMQDCPLRKTTLKIIIQAAIKKNNDVNCLKVFSATCCTFDTVC